MHLEILFMLKIYQNYIKNAESRLKFKLYNVVNENFTIKQIIEFMKKIKIKNRYI